MTDDPTKTADSLPPKGNKGAFRKGYDPRRNLRGIPSDAVALRKEVRKIAAELVALKDSGGEGDVTRLYLMLRQMMSSRNPKHNEMVIKLLGSGSLRDELDVKLNATMTWKEFIGGNAGTDSTESE